MTGDPVCDDAVIVQIGRNQSMNRIDGTREFARGYYSFGVALNLFCVLIWFVEHNKYEWTRVRPSLLVTMAALCSVAELSCGVLQSFTEESYPCWLGVVLLMLIMPFGAASVFGRYMLFTFLSRFSQSAAYVQAKEIEADAQSLAGSTVSGHPRTILERTRSVMEIIIFPNQKASSEAELRDLKMLSSTYGTAMIAFILCLPFAIFAAIILASNPVLISCYNCAYTELTFNLLIGMGATELILASGFWFLARRNKANDQWALKSECFYSLCWIAIGFSSFLASIFDSNQGKLQPYQHMFLMSVGLWTSTVVQSLVQIYLARKAVLSANSPSATFWERWFNPKLFYLFWTSETVKSEAQATPGTTSQVQDSSASPGAPSRRTMPSKPSSIRDDLDEIFADKALNELFEKHLIGEFGVESLFFVKQAEEWKRQYYDISPKARTGRARRIFKGYVQTSGLYSVNLPSKVHDRIKNKLFSTAKPGNEKSGVYAEDPESSAADDVPVDLFDDAVREIRHLLIAGAVLRFKKSSGYKNAMAGLGEFSVVSATQ